MSNPLLDVPKYHNIFYRYLGSSIYIMFFMSTLAVLAEGVGILLFLPLLESLSTSEATTISAHDSAQQVGNVTRNLDGILRFVESFLSVFGVQGSLVPILLLITLAFLFKGCMLFASIAHSARLKGRLMKKLKQQLFKGITGVNYVYYTTKNTGAFINVIVEQINRSIESFNFFAQFISQLIFSALYIFFAFIVAWRFGVMTLIAGAIVSVAFKRINIQVRAYSRETVEENKMLSQSLIEVLHAFKYLVGTGQINLPRRAIDASIARATQFQVKMGIAAALVQSLKEPIAASLIMVIVLIQLTVFNAPLAPILVSIVLFYRAISSVFMAQNTWQSTLGNVGGIEQVDRMFNEVLANQRHDSNLSVPDIAPLIHFEHVSYCYKLKQRNVLQNISMTIHPGQIVALVGRSGSGKSTLLNMIALLLSPKSGRLLINDTDSMRIQQQKWQKKIGYVCQESVIFDDTIAANIALWMDKPLDKVQLSAIKAACRKTGLDGYIESLPDKYETLVGEKGLQLSGGQKQRLFLTREVFRQPRILLLDEATSALDSISEKAIQCTIETLRDDMTVVIVAHRLSTIRNADYIYVLDSGEIVQEGTYQELELQTGEHFEQFLTAQSFSN